MNYQPQIMRKDIMTKRMNENLNLRQASKVCDISFATLSRIENGATPDLDTFGTLCSWLKTKPNKYFK